MKEWFKARYSWGAAIRTLTVEETGRLMKALWEYTMTGKQAELQGREGVIFALILFDLERDEEQERVLAKKRAVSGAAGGKQKAANLAKAKQGQEERNSTTVAEDAADGEANAANIRFATDSMANVANANNKNKNKNKSKSKNKSKEKVQEKENRFERFWRAYPRKVAKQVAMRAFEKIDPDEALLETMIAAIGKWKTTDQWNEAGGQYIPHPSTWLNQRRWEDELPKAGTVKGSVIAQQYEQRDYSGVQAELMAEQDREMEKYMGGVDI